MDLITFSYKNDQGWSIDTFPPVDSAQTIMVLVFGASSFPGHPEAIHELVLVYPQSHIAGCSTSGEISGCEINDDSLTVVVARFHSCCLSSAFSSVEESTGSLKAMEVPAGELRSPDLRWELVFSGGLHVKGSELVRGLNASLPDPVVVTGGLAGDGDRFERVRTLNDSRPAESYVPVIGLHDDTVHTIHGSKGGWDIFGHGRFVTRSEGNVLHELDSKPVLELYQTMTLTTISGAA